MLTPIQFFEYEFFEHVIEINIDFQMKILQAFVLVTVNEKFSRNLLLWKDHTEKCHLI